ncbi:MAG: hypothetical protein ACK5P7_11345 [Bdellovibrio sp.]
MKSLRIFSNTETSFKRLILFAAIGWLPACSLQSPDPTAQDLIELKGPTITGASNGGTISTTVQTYTVTGTCDQSAASLQYSYDNSSWTDSSPGCVNSSYTLPAMAITGQIKVYVRSRSVNNQYSPTFRVTINFTLPPAGSILTFVSAAHLDQEIFRGHQSAIHNGISGNSSANGFFRFDTHSLGAVYAQ